jgi:hypothetical protein
MCCETDAVTGDAVQVWLRHLDNGDELYVVLFNSGKGSCAPPSSVRCCCDQSFVAVGS